MGMSLDPSKVKPGDTVVFANPNSGWPWQVTEAKVAGLEVGQEYPVAQVDLGAFSCLLRLAGMGCWFNAVQFDESP